MNTYTDHQKACIESPLEVMERLTREFNAMSEFERAVHFDMMKREREKIETTSPMTGFSEPDGGAGDVQERALLAAGQWANADTPIVEALAYRDGFVAGASQRAAVGHLICGAANGDEQDDDDFEWNRAEIARISAANQGQRIPIYVDAPLPLASDAQAAPKGMRCPRGGGSCSVHACMEESACTLNRVCDAQATAAHAGAIEGIKRAALAATPQQIDSAQSIEIGGCVECPYCSGDGSLRIEGDYCNYDGTALGVQFYGIGPAHGAAEAYFRAANPAAVLVLIERLERAETLAEAKPVSAPAAWIERCDLEELTTQGGVSCVLHIKQGDPNYDEVALYAAAPTPVADSGATLTDEQIFAAADKEGVIKSEGLLRVVRALLAAAKPVSVDADPCEHEWQYMAEPHKECVKCGDVRPDWTVNVDARANDTRTDEEKVQDAADFICDTRLDPPVSVDASGMTDREAK